MTCYDSVFVEWCSVCLPLKKIVPTIFISHRASVVTWGKLSCKVNWLWVKRDCSSCTSAAFLWMRAQWLCFLNLKGFIPKLYPAAAWTWAQEVGVLMVLHHPETRHFKNHELIFNEIRSHLQRNYKKAPPNSTNDKFELVYSRVWRISLLLLPAVVHCVAAAVLSYTMLLFTFIAVWNVCRS